ncbi:unnamed protein product [Pocillopora meandrina]|uniref:Death domain-containing protein n=1 Tax=Pocillopora meandrina TaxID=46732 RepID=A0AAU9Y703_9CNID|nr:unnamed protein product [Pocillopora meandrina]
MTQNANLASIGKKDLNMNTSNWLFILDIEDGMHDIDGFGRRPYVLIIIIKNYLIHSYTDIDPFFLLFFSSCFKNPLSWLRSGDKEACVLLPMASEETKTPTFPVTSGIEAENAIEIKNFNEPRTSVVTELQLSDISDDVGNCWRELGPKLDISAAKIQNLDDDYRCNRDKANALLLMWKQKEGNSAVAGRLADALVSIGKKCIAEMLLGVDNAKMLRCGNIPKGHVISLTVIHDLGEGLDKLMVCEDAQGNKFMVKAFNSRDNFLKLEETLVSKRFLETVVVARQESLKRYISSELQDLRLQMKKGQLACGNVDKTDTIQDASKDKTEPTSSLLNEEVDTPNDESVEKLLQSCEEHRNHFQNMFEALIKLTAEAGQQSEDDVDCVQKLLDFTTELQQKGITLFSKIESVGTQSQLKDQQHTHRF